MKIHNKLVRDKIPAICTANGATPMTRTLDDDTEYMAALTTKLGEEAAEVKSDPCLEELADTLEVLYAIGKQLGCTPVQIEAARVKKAQQRGGFSNRIFLISTQEGAR
jgi:predicted house-cleaning noncanonical NTP pyrophosphatase (MazG superfamily)